MRSRRREVATRVGSAADGHQGGTLLVSALRALGIEWRDTGGEIFRIERGRRAAPEVELRPMSQLQLNLSADWSLNHDDAQWLGNFTDAGGVLPHERTTPKAKTRDTIPSATNPNGHSPAVAILD